MPGEDQEALRELDERLKDELRPVGELENLLVDRIVASYWRLGRLGPVEAGIFAWELYGELAERARKEANNYTKQEGGFEDLDEDLLPEILRSITPLTTTITDQEKHQGAVSKAREMDAKREAETFKLSRYEATIERSLYKALHELQRLQAARRADGGVPPPAAIHLDVTGVSGDEP